MLDERSVRLAKLEALSAKGIDPYPKQTGRTHMCGDVLASFESFESSKESLVLAGRIMTIRVHGGVMFADLRDESGSLQLVFKEDVIGEAFALFRDHIDPADFVEATGTAFTTKRGEKSLEVAEWRILTKALLPLPEKWHGLADVETRYRERELDLISNPDVRQRFVTRSRLISALRNYLDANNFLEVETPILQGLAGGAAARPFVTHHHALDVDLFLRIAPELYLKRLIVGGFEKVYEIGRCFRNEGIDPSHNPEFTMLELYWAFGEKERFLAFMEDMLGHMMQEAMGTSIIKTEGGEIDFSAPWPRITFREAIKEATGMDIDQFEDAEDVVEATEAADLSIDFSKCVGLGEHLDELYKKTARTNLRGPVWVLDYPVAMKPLSGRSAKDPQKSATAQLVVEGMEVINAYYHELNDPLDQRQRFEEQQSLSEQGSEEAQPKDEEFLTALEHGLPPTSGMGMGVDRLAAILTGAPSLKEVILYPTLRPKLKIEN